MSPEVTSLELSKKLFKLFPQAQTEYLRIHYKIDLNRWDYEIKTRQYATDNAYKNDRLVPAWQIHELLEELPDEITITKDWDNEERKCLLHIIKDRGYEAHYGYGTRFKDVSLVEALGKLLMWKLKKEGDKIKIVKGRDE